MTGAGGSGSSIWLNMVLAKADKEWVEKTFVATPNISVLINNAVAAAIKPLQATIDRLNKALEQKDKRIEDLEAQLNESIARNAALIKQRADDNEQYSKKQNIRISGISYRKTSNHSPGKRKHCNYTLRYFPASSLWAPSPSK